MKRDSKMSVLRNVVATLVGVLCFSFAGIGQVVIEYDSWMAMTVSDLGNCVGKRVFTVSIPAWQTYSCRVKNNGTQIGTLSFPQAPASGAMYYVIVDVSSKTVTQSNTPPDCVYPDDFGNYTNFSKTYYYCGPTGDASDVTNKNNWCTSRTGSAGSCTSPSNFTATSCKYVISQEDVVLKSNQVWTVSGTGSKIDVESGASFVVNGDLNYKNGVDVESNATLNIGTDAIPSFGKIKDNSTVVYSGPDNQKLKNSVTYSNLVIEKSGGTLTFPSGDVSVSGEFKPIKGKCVTTGSTFKYVGTNQTVAAFNYNNLNLGSGTRTYATNGTIGIAGSFSPSTGTNNVTGSTVEFNGTEQQTIPGFTFYNVVFNNTQYISMPENVMVTNSVDFVMGKVIAGEKKTLTVTNSEPSAVRGGSASSYIQGYLKRSLKSNMSSSSDVYNFPLGRDNTYYPFSITNITTASNPTLQVFYDLASRAYWYVSGTNYNGASVSVGCSSGIGSNNSIKGSVDGNTYQSYKGTVNGSWVKNSKENTSKYIKLEQRNITTTTYVYNCSGDVTNPNSWTQQYGSSHPSAFDIDDAIWSIACSAEVPAGKTLDITGCNSKLEVTTDMGNLKIFGSVSVAGNFSLNDKASLVVYDGGIFDVYGTYSHTGSNFSKLVNKDGGEINFYSGVLLEKVTFDNSGDVNIVGDLTFDSRSTTINKGTINCTDGTVTVREGYNGLTPSSITNSGKMIFTNCELNFRSGDNPDSWPKLTNAMGGVILVDNQNSVGKSVNFGDRVVFGEASMNGKTTSSYDFQKGSTFKILGCDLNCTLQPNSNDNPVPNTINGDLYIADGNFVQTTAGGGGHLNFGKDATIVLYDSDGDGDGVLSLNGGGGGGQVSIEGTLYAEGVSYVSGGGGCTLDTENGSTVFIGQLGASLGGNEYVTKINVKTGSTMYYCGNITAGRDDIGDIQAGSKLYYTQEDYVENPLTELDFSIDGKRMGDDGYNPSSATVEGLYESKEECQAAFKETPSSLLPVEMTLLYGVCKHETIELHWQTASEKENVGFTILKSFDGINFEEIGFVAGAGTTSEIQNYEYFDTEEKSGIVYYKVCQTDFDGKTKMSKIIAVKTCAKPSYNMTLNAQFSITDDAIEVIFENEDNQYFVTITDVTGRMFYSKAFKDTNSARINCPKSKGVYIISVSDGQQITSEKFIK